MSMVVRRAYRTAVAGVAVDPRRTGGKLSVESPVHVPQTAAAKYRNWCGGRQGGEDQELAGTLAGTGSMKPEMLVVAIIASVLVFWGPLALCLWHWWIA
jgi:hypothetical protein